MASIVFMGTPDFAVPALQRLIAAHTVIGVVTQPDRPAGRGQKVVMSPIKQTAIDAGIPVFQPEKLRRPDAIDTLRAWPCDLFIVAAFGQILPQVVLDMPRFGSINIHASLLPRWRGAAPIQAAILAGDPDTGITIMRMDAGLDTGPMLSKRTIPIAPDDTGQTLHDKLSPLGGDLLIDTLPGYLDGSIAPQVQDDALMTFAPRIDKDAGRIDWSQPAAPIERAIRAYTPWPGAYTTWEGKRLKLLSARTDAGTGEPGRVVQHDGAIAVGTGAGLLLPVRVQLEGKSLATLSDFVRGYPAFVGARLGS